jgi:hypothetical protein
MPSPPRSSRRTKKLKNSGQKQRSKDTKRSTSRPSSALSRSLPSNGKRKSPRGKVNEFRNKLQHKPQSRKNKVKSPSRFEHKSRSKQKVIAIHTANGRTAYVRQGTMSPQR